MYATAGPPSSTGPYFATATGACPADRGAAWLGSLCPRLHSPTYASRWPVGPPLGSHELYPPVCQTPEPVSPAVLPCHALLLFPFQSLFQRLHLQLQFVITLHRHCSSARHQILLEASLQSSGTFFSVGYSEGWLQRQHHLLKADTPPIMPCSVPSCAEYCCCLVICLSYFSLNTDTEPVAYRPRS